ncbi:MAG: hypothetical protein AB7T10_06650 [bacterium]
MSIIDYLLNTPDVIKGKRIQQILSICGDGKLLDNNNTSLEFREYLDNIESELIVKYANECLNKFEDSGFALQDLINQTGKRLGFTVKFGLYRGKPGDIGHDGLWQTTNNYNIIIEVKTTDAFSINLDNIAEYRKKLIENHEIDEDNSSILIVVGRQDTGGLESQIRGSKYAWDIRLISVDSLLKLMKLKENFDEPSMIQKITDILIPMEYTRVDEIINLVFNATNEIIQDNISNNNIVIDSSNNENIIPRFTPVNFHSLCIDRISNHFNKIFIKKTKASFISSDNSIKLICIISKEYLVSNNYKYWFAFHPHYKDYLDNFAQSYIVFGCGNENQLIKIPFSNFKSWLDGLNITEIGDKFYWHVHIIKKENKYYLLRKTEFEHIDITNFLL